MDLVEKYYKKVQALIDEAKAEGITIASYLTEIDNSENSFVIEQGVAIFRGENHKEIPTWKVE